jgi:magnesium chelatase family protein
VLARALSGTVFGLDGVRVEVEADIADGLPGFHIVGLGDRALQEARERVKIAINNSGFQFPGRKVTINLAPAQLPKEGSGFDLAMAAAIVNAGEDRGLPGDAAWLGELALDGTLRAIRGTLAIVAHLDRLGVRRFYVPVANVAEARIATAATVHGINHLRQLKAHWESGALLEASSVAAPPPASLPAHVDLADVHGQPYAKRALEVAAAGAHHLLLVGPPGTGKTLLARALPGILPPLSRREAVEVTSIASCVGMLPAGAGLLEVAPFRAPHHSNRWRRDGWRWRARAGTPCSRLASSWSPHRIPAPAALPATPAACASARRWSASDTVPVCRARFAIGSTCKCQCRGSPPANCCGPQLPRSQAPMFASA